MVWFVVYTNFKTQGGGFYQLSMPLNPEYTLPTESGLQGQTIVYTSEYEPGFLGIYTMSGQNAPVFLYVLSIHTYANSNYHS